MPLIVPSTEAELAAYLASHGLRQHDSITSLWCRSDSRAGREHLLNLEDYFGNGACNCESARFNFEPKLSTGVDWDGSELRCKHVRRARRVLAYLFLDTFLFNRLNADHAKENQKTRPVDYGISRSTYSSHQTNQEVHRQGVQKHGSEVEALPQGQEGVSEGASDLSGLSQKEVF